MHATSTVSTSRHTGANLRGLGYWPADLLQAFTLQMSSHGFSVSSSMMMGDRDYAVEQLAHAHTMADGRLRDLALQLFHHFERQQEGIVTRGQ